MLETRHAQTPDGVSIAFQVVGDGPIDLVYVPEFASHIEHARECPPYADFLRLLAVLSRLVTVDRRGTGGSDPVGDIVPPVSPGPERSWCPTR
ncbi:MAG: hypothetical protein M3P10_00925 [Actinomycetota bacterium]|nr:hypothetical protein [Actinomycetota bacterium]